MVAFVAGGLIGGGIIVRYNIVAARATTRLKAALSSNVIGLKALESFAFKKALLLKPDSIRDAGDTIEVKAAKDELIAQAKKMAPTLLWAWGAMLLCMTLGVISGILEFWFNR